MPVKNFRHTDRRLVASISRFELYFDRQEVSDTFIVPDFLVVHPKPRTDTSIVAICVLPEVAGRIGLMSTHRHTFDAPIWRAPAGFIEVGEDPAVTDSRELSEETGLVCPPERLISLGAFLPDAGVIDGKVALYAAPGVRGRWMKHLFAGGGYDRTRLMDEAVYLDSTVEIVRRIDAEPGFHVLPWRWVVERTFGRLTRWRRLVRDSERRIDVSGGMMLIAMSSLLLRRVCH